MWCVIRYSKFLLFVFIVLLSACGDKIDTNMSEQLEDFQFTTQNNEELSLDDLKGDYWIASLTYTSCTTICPRTTVNMDAVQKKLKEDGFTPRIISFSVDPEHDSPEVLKSFAEDYEVDLSTWDFLTGYDYETIKHISESSFKAALHRGADNQMAHGYGFYLVDPDGIIVKKYDGMSDDDLDKLVEDVEKVS